MFELVIKAETAEELKTKVIQMADIYDVRYESVTPAEQLLVKNTPEEFVTDKPVQPSAPVYNPHTVAPELKVTPEIRQPKASVDINVQAEGLDAAGLPWDARIHASSKAKTVDGYWRARRGVDESLVSQVEAELKGKSAIVETAPSAVPQVVTPPPPAPTVHVEMPSQPVSAPIMQTPVATPTYENVTVPSGGKPAHSFATFKTNIIMIITALLTEGKITKEYLDQICAHYGISGIWEITKNDQNALELFEGFVNYGFITKVG